MFGILSEPRVDSKFYFLVNVCHLYWGLETMELFGKVEHGVEAFQFTRGG